MEEVLHRPTAIRRGCKLQKNDVGLYDLEVNDESGIIIADVKNITFLRAVTVIEDYMYTRRAFHDRE